MAEKLVSEIRKNFNLEKILMRYSPEYISKKQQRASKSKLKHPMALSVDELACEACLFKKPASYYNGKLLCVACVPPKVQAQT